ncbi:phosphohydrolase [Candidatus Shapirobacteria bacterium CG07_land_8_20_14_0_80_39_18]|uniref:Phosphohydrolase n=1 Tax=Candidatus Shapirobacteria bacterium CG07_land_8_20_14_0_80_39_18 TaxID=1974882 RepID=A0A2M6YRN8_9BACT|nr:MAG: phosphohydrolase [Candidatus Shapirobacteria bacterium CG07_land_8_20_14_0_80_39_18]
MDSFLKQIKKEAKKFFTKVKGSHGWDHTERVYALCLRIGRKEKANLEVLKLAAFLHDIGREEETKSKGKICHAERGALLARRILEKYNLDTGLIEQVIHCIDTHRFRGSKIPQSKEAKILFDADKLDSIGAVGIGRDFLFAGEVGAKLYNRNFNVSNSLPYTKEDTAYREYMVKLRKIKSRIFTAEGKIIAKERHRFMVDFFNRLEKEAKGIL